jgi:hypothetical protein
MEDRGGMQFAAGEPVSYGLVVMTLEEIKQAIEKLPREEFFELARRLSTRYSKLCGDGIGRDEGRGQCGVVSGEKE